MYSGSPSPTVERRRSAWAKSSTAGGRVVVVVARFDGTKLVEAGYDYHYTSAGTVEDFAQALRLRSTVGEGDPEYTYQADVEQFFKHSPAVVRDPSA